MSTVRIITGNLKGRRIPFTGEKFSNAEITPQKVKGAVFSSIGEFLEGKVFIDLFACSGQIGIEALSRGAFSVFNDLEKKFTDSIKQFLDKTGVKEGYQIYNFNAERAVRQISNKGIKADYIYLDPPYIKEKNVFSYYKEILYVIEKCSLLNKDGLVIIQHYSKNIIDDKFSGFIKLETRIYGTTALTYFVCQE